MDLGEELQITDSGRPRDGHLGIRVHGEGHHAVDVGGRQTRIVEGVQHRLGGQPQLAPPGVLGEVRRTDPGDRRLPRKLAGHQAFPSIVSVEVAITWSPRLLLPVTFTVMSPSSMAVTSPENVTVS